MSDSITLSRFKISIGRFGSSKLLRAGFWLPGANVGVGLLGYVYQVLMGRMLSPADFALLSAVMALITFFSSPLSAMFMVISRRVSALRAQAQFDTLRSLYSHAHEYLAWGGLIFLLLLIPFADTAQAYLKSPGQAPIWIFGVFMIFGAFLLVNNAYFQGMQRFGWLGAISASGMALRIALSMLFIILGYGVNGALFGVLLATASMWLVGGAAIRQGFSPKGINSRQSIEAFPIKTVLPVLIANIAFAAMTQLDMVLVNWYFPAEQAGIYAAASVLGKAVLYLPGGLVMALYPMVAENHAKDKGSAYLMLQAAAITAALCSLAAVVYWLFGEWLVSLLYGKPYAGAGELLRWYGFAILPMALVMVAEHFLIAQGRVLFAWLFLGMAPLQVLAIHFWHAQLWMVIAIMGLCGAALFTVGYAMLWGGYRRAQL